MEKSIFPVITEEESKLPFILKSVGCQNRQEHIDRPEGYPDFHWLHCVEGKGRLRMNGEEHILEGNSGFFLRPGVPHEYYALHQPWKTHWLTFNGYASDNILTLLGIGSACVFTNLDIARLDCFLEKIYTKAQIFTPYRGFECSYLVYGFLVELREILDSAASGYKAASDRLKPVIDLMESGYNRPLTLDEMAAAIRVTPRHLCRLFKQFYNMSPFDYLIGYRIKKAKESLIYSSGRTIKEISQKTGFQSPSYFCAVFKELEGMTPLEFRQMHR